MSKQRMIDTCYWDDTYVVTLDPSEKLVFLYLLTNPLTNICGVYEIATKRIAFDTGFDKEVVERILARFERDGRCVYRGGWVAMLNWIKHQRLNPSVEQGIARELEKVPQELAAYVRGETDSPQSGTPNSTEPNSTELKNAVATAPARNGKRDKAWKEAGDLFVARGGAWASGAKEAVSLDRLIAWVKREQPARWEEFLRAFMDGAWELVQGRVAGLPTKDKEWWMRQPYTPSSLLSLAKRVVATLSARLQPPDADAIVEAMFAEHEARERLKQ